MGVEDSGGIKVDCSLEGRLSFSLYAILYAARHRISPSTITDMSREPISCIRFS